MENEVHEVQLENELEQARPGEGQQENDKIDQTANDETSSSGETPDTAPDPVDDASGARVNTAESAQDAAPEKQHEATKTAKTYVGGLLASDKSLKPFRSLLTSKTDINAGQGQTQTPTRPLATSTNTRPTITPFRTCSLASSHGASGLNKPFRSPVVAHKSASSPSLSSNPSEGPHMSSLQLASALLNLERRLARLKDAKRVKRAQDLGQENENNTEHILALSRKWLKAGREAAEMLWELTKARYDEGGAESHAAGARPAQNSFADSWGWAAPDPAEEIRRKVKEEFDSLNEEEKQEAIRMAEDDDGKDPLPDVAVASLKRSSSSLSNGSSASSADTRASKRTRREGNLEDIEENEAAEQHEGTSEDEAFTPEEESEVPDDPMSRGMAKMLTQCGIE